MTTFITMKHRKTGGMARMPEQTEDHWKAKGWQKVKDPDGITPDSPYLPEQVDEETAAELSGEATTTSGTS